MYFVYLSEGGVSENYIYPKISYICFETAVTQEDVIEHTRCYVNILCKYTGKVLSTVAHF